MESGNTENNVVLFHSTESISVVSNNIVSMTHAVDLHVVESDNVLDLATALVDVAVDATEEAGGSCTNGVCSVSWKPKRPTAA
ncbi:MAG TPA: hypothetical protein V6C76_07385 [Drouetiella sp.]